MEYFGQFNLPKLLSCCLLILMLSGHVLGEDEGAPHEESVEVMALEAEGAPTPSVDNSGDHAVSDEVEGGPVFVPTFENVYEARAQALKRQKQAKDRPSSAGHSEENEAE